MPISLPGVLPISNYCRLTRKRPTCRLPPSSTKNPSHDSVLTAIDLCRSHQTYCGEEVGHRRRRRRWRHRGGKREGGGNAFSAGAEQEVAAAAAQGKIRMKRTQCGELEKAAQRNKGMTHSSLPLPHPPSLLPLPFPALPLLL